MDIVGQYQFLRKFTNAAAVNANSIVERNPKSKGSGEEHIWRLIWVDLEEDLFADDVCVKHLRPAGLHQAPP